MPVCPLRGDGPRYHRFVSFRFGRSAVMSIYARFASLLHELGRFGVVGAICYVIDVGVFNLWLYTLHEPISGKVVSTVIAASVAFAGNRTWTWRDRERTGLHREYGLYFGFNLIGLFIGVVCLWASHYVLGSIWPSVFATKLADNISGNVVGVAFASIFRFWAYRRFVFRPRPVIEHSQ